MTLLDVYPLLDVAPVRALGSELFDKDGKRYLDLYGGHAVISIGHTHPHYVNRIEEQLRRLAFYSNSVHLEVQHELAEKLGQVSGYPDYRLFLCNSGAEANENALKLASFTNGRKRVIAFEHGWHGRTSGAVAVTDDPPIRTPFNSQHDVRLLPLNDPDLLAEELRKEDVAAVIVEGIQGVAGVYEPDDAFLRAAEALCKQNGTLLILDEVQSGYGRSGQFFAHQRAGIRPELITIAKGMGNGFPVGGVLVAPQVPVRHGMLGTTFGGNPLACAAALAVLEVMEAENLLESVHVNGERVQQELQQIAGIIELRGRGLMYGIELSVASISVRRTLLKKYGILLGSAHQLNTVRLLPALNVSREHLKEFVVAMQEVLHSLNPTRN